MDTERSTEAVREQGEAVMRSFVRGRIASEPEFVRTMEGVGVCRLVVIGQAGLASSPPRVSLYIRDGEQVEDGGEEDASPLRPDEAQRCAFHLGEGDLIQAVGNIGPERAKAKGQEVGL